MGKMHVLVLAVYHCPVHDHDVQSTVVGVGLFIEPSCHVTQHHLLLCVGVWVGVYVPLCIVLLTTSLLYVCRN